MSNNISLLRLLVTAKYSKQLKLKSAESKQSSNTTVCYWCINDFFQQQVCSYMRFPPKANKTCKYDWMWLRLGLGLQNPKGSRRRRCNDTTFFWAQFPLPIRKTSGLVAGSGTKTGGIPAQCQLLEPVWAYVDIMMRFYSTQNTNINLSAVTVGLEKIPLLPRIFARLMPRRPAHSLPLNLFSWPPPSKTIAINPQMLLHRRRAHMSFQEN